MKMKKYLFIMAQEGYRWGGSEPLWSSAAERLASQGNEVRVSVKNWGARVPQIEHLRAVGCQIFYRRASVQPLMQRIVRKLIPQPDYAPEHVRKIGTGADLVVVSQGANFEGLQWMEACRSNDYQYATIAQGAAEQWWPTDEIAERLAGAYEGACGAYFVSDANLALSRLQFVTPLSHGRVIRNPFNVRYDAQPPWPSSDSAELALACVGRLEIAQKSQDLLMEVLSLPRWRERKVRLSLVGSGVNERGLRRWVASSKLVNVDFAGFVDDIEQLWSRHHALVLPSRYEGMPLVLVEAMLCARPCIVTDVAGHRELVRDGVNGFLAKAPTVELLDEAMNRAWESRHRLKEMGEQAAIDVRKFVSPDPTDDFVRELCALVDGRET